MKNLEENHAMETVSSAKQNPVSQVKAYQIDRDLWTVTAAEVVAACVDAEGNSLAWAPWSLAVEAVEAMQSGDRLQVQGLSVFCSMVDPSWYEGLPENDGR